MNVSKIRIQKLLSELGVASRRAVEQMVLEGRISVNGRTRKRLPVLVTPGDDEIRLDGATVKVTATPKVYFLLNKPRGVVCTQRDPEGRRRAIDVIRNAPRGVHCVGRLDMASTGLIVLTNDGELTQQITHPRYGVAKTYVVEIDGRMTEDRIARLKAPTYLDGRRTGGLRTRVLRRSHTRSSLEITLREGRNREVRRVLARLGHKVRRLKRTAIGPVTDRGLKIGSYRTLTKAEVAALLKASQTPGRQGGSTRGPKGAKRPRTKQKINGKPVGGDRLTVS